VPLNQPHRLVNRSFALDTDRILDESHLVALDAFDDGRLLGDGQPHRQDPQPTLLAERERHFVARDGSHRRAEQRQPQPEPGQFGRQRDIGQRAVSRRQPGQQ